MLGANDFDSAHLAFINESQAEPDNRLKPLVTLNRDVGMFTGTGWLPHTVPRCSRKVLDALHFGIGIAALGMFRRRYSSRQRSINTSLTMP